jgi:hypothetical protein
MHKAIASAICALVLIAATSEPAEARRGRFVTSLIARGATHATTPGTTAPTSAPKTYGPDVLSVQQLTDCLRKADQLDRNDGSVGSDRELVRAKFSQVDSLKSEIDRSEATLNRSSQSAIDRLNAAVRRYNAMVGEARSMQTAFNQRIEAHNSDVNAYNAACAKRYYADDLDAAKLAAGLQ